MSDWNCFNCGIFKASEKHDSPLTCHAESRKARYVKKDQTDFDWFSPSEFHYCPPQLEWFFMNGDDVRSGKWPLEPVLSEHVNPGRSSGVKIPSFAAALIAAEIDWRMDCCGVDGKLLEAEIIAGRQLSPESLKAMAYISGNARKCILKYCPFCKKEMGVYKGDSQRLYCWYCGKVRSVHALKRRHYSQWKSHGKLD